MAAFAMLQYRPTDSIVDFRIQRRVRATILRVALLTEMVQDYDPTRKYSKDVLPLGWPSLQRKIQQKFKNFSHENRADIQPSEPGKKYTDIGSNF